jgi:hypothetical protein
MGGKTPKNIKEKVLKFWLSGIARKKSAEKARIGDGTVTSIVQEARQNIPDIDLLRAVAVKIKSKDWDLNIFSSAIRHREMLQRKGLSDDQIDSLIENVDEYGFKHGTTSEHFVNLVQNMAIISSKYDCPIDKLPDLIEEKEIHLEYLEQKIKSLGNYFEEYEENKPLMTQLNEAIQTNRELSASLNLLRAKWLVLIPPEHAWGVVEDEVLEAAQLLVKNPFKGIQLVCSPL